MAAAKERGAGQDPAGTWESERTSLLGGLSARAELREGGVALLHLKGRITSGDGDEMVKQAVEELAAQGRLRIVLHLGAVTYMDSSGVDAVVRSYNKLADRRGVLRLVVSTDRIRSLFEITKLLTVIETFATPAEALAGL